ncbi:MAG: heavy metal-binding domain-containing protein [Candidatus Methanomethylophilus sp.]|jgi:uncharacterized protein YbjQ (UPF0145 family)|nr:heavy metal-binding domain-containing protein [Methanomethylophilus sp.]MCI2093752.1 heavy metal-binding domain-containing protein [Methanomethylophilus sp.]
MIVTTTKEVPGKNFMIIGIAKGTGGGEEHKKSLSECCDEALSDLEDCARQMYADAVVAVSLSVTETGGEKHRHNKVLAYGTAVSFLDRGNILDRSVRPYGRTFCYP